MTWILRRTTVPAVGMPPGQYRPVRTDTGERKAIIACPQCGRGQYLPHTVDMVGTVTPSVVCAYAQAGCTFHATVTLDTWNET